MTEPGRHGRLWIWLKVALLLILVEVLLFRTDWFWSLRPEFAEPTRSENDNWKFVFETAGAIEAGGRDKDTVVVIGSSVLRYGLDPELVNAELDKRGVPVHVLPFISLGSSDNDTARVAWQARRLRPWMVIYAAALRHFYKHGIVDSAVKRTFYDSSVELPLWPREGLEAEASAFLKTHWQLYRYRYFARRALLTWLRHARDLLSPAHATAAPSTTQLPAEAHWIFGFQITPASWDAWQRWRQTRQFEDYIAWIDARGGHLALNLYKSQNLASTGPAGNPHAEALSWMLARLEDLHQRAAIVYFPENPVFFDPAAKSYYDSSLSQAYIDLFAGEARKHGDLFVNWRAALPAEDFYDMIHVNAVGRQKLVGMFADLIEKQWRAAPGREGAA